MTSQQIEAALLQPFRDDLGQCTKLSQQLLQAVKLAEKTNAIVAKLASISIDVLQAELNHDSKKKAFWINIYNAFGQRLLNNPEAANKNRLQMFLLFNRKEIVIAGQPLSLNMIEHHYFRRSKVLWSRGYIKRWFPTGFEKKVRVDRLDPRIHFALNCGAKSCPPSRF